MCVFAVVKILFTIIIGGISRCAIINIFSTRKEMLLARKLFRQMMMLVVKLFTNFVVQSSGCGHNYAESVNLFSDYESGKFKRGSKRTFFCVISFGMAWSCCLFYLEGLLQPHLLK